MECQPNNKKKKKICLFNDNNVQLRMNKTIY